MLKANLMSDEREVEYLIIFLGIEINLNNKIQQLVPGLLRFPPEAINQAHEAKANKTKVSLMECIAQSSLNPGNNNVHEALHKALELKMHTREEALVQHLGVFDSIVDEFRHPVNFSFIVIPENYMALHDRYFYKECKKCDSMGLLALCVICGDTVCLKDCDLENKNEPTIINHENV